MSARLEREGRVEDKAFGTTDAEIGVDEDYIGFSGNSGGGGFVFGGFRHCEICFAGRCV